MEQHPSPVAPQAPPETTITRRVGRDLALMVLGAGRLRRAAVLFAILATSDSRLLSRGAFAGYLTVSAGAWIPAPKHPGRAVLAMSLGFAALLGLMIAAWQGG